MKRNTLYKSEPGKRAILDLYDQKLAALQIDYHYERVETTFGETNLIITGNAKNPPLLLIHGSNGCAPIAIETYPNLHKKYQVLAVDVLAQPNKSAENRLSMEDDSYGKWIHELISQLGLKQVTLVGFSFGGLIILKTLIHQEGPIKEVFIAAPAYIVNGNPLIALWKVFMPMKRYMKTKKQTHIQKFLRSLFSEKDEFAIEYLSKVFLYFNMDFTPVPTIRKKDANAIKTPITIIAAGNDILFPGRKMIKRANKIFPSLKKTILLEQSKHVQNRSDNHKIEALILRE